MNDVEILDRNGETAATFRGEKEAVARKIFEVIEERLIRKS
jgi:phosphopantothenoylcysteine synthetase/decarboxylase